MHLALWVIAIGYGNPDPFHTGVLGLAADLRRKLAFLQQGNDMRTAQLAEEFEIPAAGTVIKRHPSIANFDKVVR